MGEAGKISYAFEPRKSYYSCPATSKTRFWTATNAASALRLGLIVARQAKRLIDNLMIAFSFFRHSVGFGASFQSFNLLKDDVHKQKFEQYSIWIKFFLFKIKGVGNLFVPLATSRPSWPLPLQRTKKKDIRHEIRHFIADVMAMTKIKSSPKT